MDKNIRTGFEVEGDVVQSQLAGLMSQGQALGVCCGSAQGEDVGSRDCTCYLWSMLREKSMSQRVHLVWKYMETPERKSKVPRKLQLFFRADE